MNLKLTIMSKSVTQLLSTSDAKSKLQSNNSASIIGDQQQKIYLYTGEFLRNLGEQVKLDLFKY